MFRQTVAIKFMRRIDMFREFLDFIYMGFGMLSVIISVFSLAIGLNVGTNTAGCKLDRPITYYNPAYRVGCFLVTPFEEN